MYIENARWDVWVAVVTGVPWYVNISDNHETLSLRALRPHLIESVSIRQICFSMLRFRKKVTPGAKHGAPSVADLI